MCADQSGLITVPAGQPGHCESPQPCSKVGVLAGVGMFYRFDAGFEMPISRPISHSTRLETGPSRALGETCSSFPPLRAVPLDSEQQRRAAAEARTAEQMWAALGTDSWVVRRGGAWRVRAVETAELLSTHECGRHWAPTAGW